MTKQGLLGLEVEDRPDATEQRGSGGRPRLRMAERQQVEMVWASLDQLLDPEHPARAVWEAVNQCDFQCLLQEIRAVEGEVGRNATDPRILWRFGCMRRFKGWPAPVVSPN